MWPVALLLCDLDDTLADRRSLFAAWAQSYLRRIGQDPAELTWLTEQDANGYTPRPEFFRRVIERFSPDEPLEAFEERYHDEYIRSFRCEAEVIDALGRARRAGLRIAIVTNGQTRAQGGKVGAAALADLVDACCISEAEGYWKPAPELFRIAAERCNEPLDGAWMVGDNPVTDVGGAAALGLSTVWIRLGRTWPHDLDYAPTREADTFPEAVDAVLAQMAVTGDGV